MSRNVAGTSEGCVSCHSDARGPFVFEHAPLRIKDCQTCHQPHGSVNSRMLVRSRVQQLCLECHTTGMGLAAGTPPAFHDIRTARYQNCTVCHRQIHGSNADRHFLK